MADYETEKLIADTTQKFIEESATEEQPVVEQATEQQEEAPKIESVPQEQQQSKEDVAARNFKALRERAERIEQEKNEALRRLQEYEAREKALPETVERKIDRIESELRRYTQQSQNAALEARLKAQYADFDKVVSVENVEALKNQYPELASTLQSSNDIYATAVSAYTMIKKLGIAPDQQTTQNRTQAQANYAKPRPAVSVSPQSGQGPLSQANAFAQGMTPELQQQLLREMEEARKAF